MRVILLLKVQDFNVDMPVVCMPNRGLRRRSHHNSREPAVYSIILLRPQLNKNEKEKEKKKREEGENDRGRKGRYFTAIRASFSPRWLLHELN